MRKRRTIVLGDDVGTQLDAISESSVERPVVHIEMPPDYVGRPTPAPSGKSIFDIFGVSKPTPKVGASPYVPTLMPQQQGIPPILLLAGAGVAIYFLVRE
jgi:hypothetical protein